MLAVGQAIDVYPGCDRLKATCVAKYNNLNGTGAAGSVGFSGFPDIGEKNPYTEGLS